MNRVALSLVAHTNVGKTALARTLLGRDVGEVRDAPHVTEFAEVHTLLATPEGDELLLWDTPGFADSARLARRLAGSASPIGWFLSQVWDRWRDRGFWASQQALRHVRDESDLVLYLVNAAEPPGAGSVAAELQLLGWIGKPVVVLLNQLGAPRAPEEEAAEVARWRTQLAAQPLVKAVLPLDAFARCWVQEGVLLDAVAVALGAERLAPLQREWARRRLATFDAAMEELAASLARIGAMRVELADRGWIADQLRLLKGREAEAAQSKLLALLDEEVRASTGRLLALHGLEGSAGGEILERVGTLVDLKSRVDEGRAALVGGVVTGALAGLKADLATGGLTLGGGMVAGGLLGALGAAGLARGLNVVRGTERSHAGWRAEAMPAFAEAALLRYLAVAHFGRGRGQWREGEAPPHWREVVAQAAQARRDAFGEGGAVAAGALRDAAAAVLESLYPGTWPDQRTATV